MSLRDIILFVVFFGVLPFALTRPPIGVALWSWVSYMNPHRLTWGIAYNFPFAMLAAGALLMSLFISKQPKRFSWNGLTATWLLFILLVVLSTFYSLNPYNAYYQLESVLKIQLTTLITILVMRDRKNLDLLIWVIALSIGYYSIKGGVFTILTGGGHRVYGPASSMIAENNALAVAILMIIPLFNYLRITATNIWVKRGLLAAMGLSFISVLGSQSRGAFLAIIAVTGFFFLKSKNKMLVLILLVMLMPIALLSMPDSWVERMETIQDYETDPSAMGRIRAWEYSINLASHRVLGGGFGSWTLYNYSIYLPGVEIEKAYVAHSIYFEVLANHGWPGLFAYLLVLFLAWRYCSQVIAVTKKNTEMEWANNLARMVQVSLVAYCSGGAFLSLSYFDLPWHLIAISVLLRDIVRDQQKVTAQGAVGGTRNKLATPPAV